MLLDMKIALFYCSEAIPGGEMSAKVLVKIKIFIIYDRKWMKLLKSTEKPLIWRKKTA